MTRLLAILLDWSRGARLARTTVVLASATGLVAGLGTTALVAVINVALAGEPARAAGMFGLPLASVFIALCVLVPVAGIVSQLLLVRLTAQAAKDLRLRLAGRILAAPYQLLEELGAPRLLATFTDDIANVTAAVTSLPVLIMQVGIMAGCLFYLGWLSWPLLVAVVIYMALGIATHALPMRRAMVHFRLLREQWDRMFEAFRGLSEGAKELKLNRARRRVFLDEELGTSVEAIRVHSVWSNSLSTAAGNWGQILFFAFIGLLVFARLPFLAVAPHAVTGYALTILFMITPLTIILNTMPAFGRAHVAAAKIRALGLSLDGHAHEPLAALPAGSVPDATGAGWTRLELAGVTHTFHGAGAIDDFTFGPIDLALVPGELVFVIGGNGSGKTTLAKLLTGLYEPDGGELRLDGARITADNRDAYRQHFSTVFSDFYLFDRLPDGAGGAAEIDAAGQRYLERLQLDHKVAITGGRLSTTQLSAGQRKRLALLVAYLEDRPLYVFDEWAADQDPAFRQVFYQRLLPDLRAQGKTVVVITHDDRYFDVADRVIKLERGRIVSDPITHSPATPEPIHHAVRPRS